MPFLLCLKAMYLISIYLYQVYENNNTIYCIIYIVHIISLIVQGNRCGHVHLLELDILTITCLIRESWLAPDVLLEAPSPGDTEWEQVVLCGGVFV